MATFKDLHIENSKNYKRQYCDILCVCVCVCVYVCVCMGHVA